MGWMCWVGWCVWGGLGRAGWDGCGSGGWGGWRRGMAVRCGGITRYGRKWDCGIAPSSWDCGIMPPNPWDCGIPPSPHGIAESSLTSHLLPTTRHNPQRRPPRPRAVLDEPDPPHTGAHPTRLDPTPHSAGIPPHCDPRRPWRLRSRRLRSRRGADRFCSSGSGCGAPSSCDATAAAGCPCGGLVPNNIANMPSSVLLPQPVAAAAAAAAAATLGGEVGWRSNGVSRSARSSPVGSALEAAPTAGAAANRPAAPPLPAAVCVLLISPISPKSIRRSKPEDPIGACPSGCGGGGGGGGGGGVGGGGGGGDAHALPRGEALGKALGKALGWPADLVWGDVCGARVAGGWARVLPVECWRWRWSSAHPDLPEDECICWNFCAALARRERSESDTLSTPRSMVGAARSFALTIRSRSASVLDAARSRAAPSAPAVRSRSTSRCGEARERAAASAAAVRSLTVPTAPGVPAPYCRCLCQSTERASRASRGSGGSVSCERAFAAFAAWMADSLADGPARSTSATASASGREGKHCSVVLSRESLPSTSSQSPRRIRYRSKSSSARPTRPTGTPTDMS